MSAFLIGLVVVAQVLGIRIVPRKQATARRPPLLNIPKHSFKRKLSVVIMNHDRPYVLQRSTLLSTLSQHPNVSEILLLHSNPKSIFDSSKVFSEQASSKIIDLDAVALNAKMGLALRFHYCAEHAQNDWVLIMDDDIEIDATGTAIDALLYHMHQNAKRIIGHFGRNLKQSDIVRKYLLRTPVSYDTKTLYGNVEVVLTKILLLERDVCVEFQKQMHIMEDFVVTSKPFWNGEDIFVNLVANRFYRVPLDGPYSNFAIADLPVWEANVSAPEKGEVKSISGNLDDSRLWKVSFNENIITVLKTKGSPRWRQVGFSRWWAAYRRSKQHNQYRQEFWLLAKDRLSKTA